MPILGVALGCHAALAQDAHSVDMSAKSSHLLPQGNAVRELLLDGDWQAGIDRHYDRVLRVPGLATDPTRPTSGTLWYKRTIDIPPGDWSRATLILKGARFAPQVYINGTLVSSAEGGMAATIHRFALTHAPGQGSEMTLEIALQSLNDLDPHDASAVPGADRWRNNVSSYLWDSVVLRLHGQGEIARIIPTSDLRTDSLSLKWELAGVAISGSTLRFAILDSSGKTVAETTTEAIGVATNGTNLLRLNKKVASWSPEHPNLYRLRTELLAAGGQMLDACEQNFGQREFSVEGLGFRLNEKPYHLRTGTVVWHRWSRDPEAKRIAFDPVWFENNVLLRMKRLGANGLRFHLGLPPDSFLDLCDRDGLAVQMEWPFFHGINASPESMKIQWRSWLDTAMRHPCVVIVHPWNETDGGQLKAAWSVLNPLLQEYPPLVVAHRDVTPVHKYWWSLFENVGLYYDSAAQFDQAVMVDEFGGDYLDGKGNPGGYPATRETFLRFLGRNNTREQRLQLQADANARIAEYWRRLGVAGFSPFCILGSPQDGSHWFLGPTDVDDAKPKPVWAALAAAWAPKSVSLEIWNRNFAPGETIQAPLYLFNDSDDNAVVRASVHVVDASTSQDAVPPVSLEATVKAQGSQIVPATITMPKRPGEWRIEARLEGAAATAGGSPVISSWRIRTFVPTTTAALQSTSVGVLPEETELRAMLTQRHLRAVEPSDAAAQVLLGGPATWMRLRTDSSLRARFDEMLHSGKSIVLIDAGPQPLGAGYTKVDGKLGGQLEGAPTVAKPAILEESALFGGAKVSFTETAEPESALQPAEADARLWSGVPHEATWLWNGLRGGLIVPAADMQVSGLSGKAMLSTWQARGADSGKIASGNYFAYELAGYYSFSDRGDDKAVSDGLRRRVKQRIEDAPALQSSVNPDAPIVVTDLAALYTRSAPGGQVESVTPLANAGKNLSRIPIVKLDLGSGAGSVIVSQVITQGRLVEGIAEQGPGVYGRRYDPVGVQFVLNMLDLSLQKR